MNFQKWASQRRLAAKVRFLNFVGGFEYLNLCHKDGQGIGKQHG